MKRRSFLQSIGAGIAALFVPAVISAKYKKVAHDEPVLPSVRILRNAYEQRRAIYSGDICVWDNGAYRPARVSDDINVFGPRVAIAVPDGSGGFTFARYPECMDVVMDIEIRGGRA